MNDIVINHTNISKIVPLLLKLEGNIAQAGYQEQVEALLTSLHSGWQAYSQTKICFKKGETLINIIDHYLRALVDTAKALYTLINEDAKKQLQQHFEEDR